MNKNEESVSDKIRRLEQKWDGGVYIAYYPNGMGPRNLEFYVSNVTDEGLPIGVDEKNASGDTLSDALDNALEGNTWDWTDNWDTVDE